MKGVIVTDMHRSDQLTETHAVQNRDRYRAPTFVLTVLALVVGLWLIGSALWAYPSTTATGFLATEMESVALTPVSVVPASAATSPELWGVSDIAARTVDAVVVVEVVIARRGPDATGSGSGVIVSEDGTIVTNFHVIENATSIVVELTDGSRYPARVVTVETGLDLAILDIDATGLPVVELGSTDGLAVGHPVIAIGNPLALEGGPSVTTGIVSALNRTVGTDPSLTGIIQTDAAITEGSSGGALLDGSGRLIGITTAVGVSRVGLEGIGFAVPVETVSEILGTFWRP